MGRFAPGLAAAGRAGDARPSGRARVAAVTGIWVADTPANERLRLYCRGNVGEVFPHVITALTATLIGDEVRRAQTQLFVDMGVLRPHEVDGPTVSTGVFGGYLYMNVSAMRLFGVRMPGMTPATAEEQVTGTIEELPPYRREKGDRNLAATVAISRLAFTLLRRPDLDSLDVARRDAERWAATMPDLAGADDAELLEWLQTYPPRLGSEHAAPARSRACSAPRHAPSSSSSWSAAAARLRGW